MKATLKNKRPPAYAGGSDLMSEIIGVIGSGTMGNGIAQVAARAGYLVVMRDVNEEFLQRGISLIDKSLKRDVDKGRLSTEAKQSIIGRIQTTIELEALRDASFVIEAVTEDLSIKTEVFQALDFMTLQGITGASVYEKMHSMCNGANMAYERAAFHEVEGFKGIDNIASGDDMLLMHKIYKHHPGGVMFLKSANAIVQTMPVQTLKELFNQSIRWASKADQYDDKRIFFVLLVVYFFTVFYIIQYSNN